MEFLKNFEFKPAQILKVAGIILLAVAAITIIVSLASISLPSLIRQGSDFALEESGAPGFAGSYSDKKSFQNSTPQLSARNAADSIAPAPDGGTTGSDAENFEITQYNASIETRDKKKTCTIISNLKSFDYVIFENATDYERGCDYTFKVERSHRDEILNTIKDLRPKSLTENTRTIKREIDDFTSEEEILKKKLSVVEDTLKNAVASYDEIGKVATEAKDAESLAKIIDSKIQTVERLTQERVNITEQLSRLSRSKAEQLDKLEYTYFQVNIYENKFIDLKNIKDTWKEAVKNFFREANSVFQDLSVNLIIILLYLIKFALYALILLFAAKYGWRLAMKVWKR